MSDDPDWPPTRRQIADAIKVAAMNDDGWADTLTKRQKPGQDDPHIPILRMRARVLHYAADRILAQEAKRHEDVPQNR